jgi:hypothetical protein
MLTVPTQCSNMLPVRMYYCGYLIVPLPMAHILLCPQLEDLVSEMVPLV